MLVETTDLNLLYQDGKDRVYAAHDVSLRLPETGLHVILGPSGSGKSSLLYLLAGIKQPTGGTVSFAGRPLPKQAGELNRLRRREMGFVFQTHFLINYLTVLENVLVGSLRDDKAAVKKARKLLELLGLDGLEARKPYQLSGGQRQRVAIARAFINEPRVVFVDEPTASLDHVAGRKVIALLKEFSQHACIVVVTHDESILENTDSVHRMSDGRLTTA